MWSHRVCDVLAVAVSGQLEKRTNIYIFFVCFFLWCSVNPPMVNGFAKEKKTLQSNSFTFISSFPSFLPGQTSCILHYNAFSVMQTLDFVFIFFYYNLLLYRVYSVKSVDLYQIYLSEKKNINETLVCPKTV